MVSNLYLNDMLKHINQFKGTYSCNNIPNLTSMQNLFIVNLSKENCIGTHFISLYIFSIKSKWVIEYFDPLGNKCTNNFILKYMKRYSNNYSYSSFAIQSKISNRCGLFCMGYVIECSKYGGNIFTFVKKFNLRQSYVNDRKIDNFILKHI